MPGVRRRLASAPPPTTPGEGVGGRGASFIEAGQRASAYSGSGALLHLARPLLILFVLALLACADGASRSGGDATADASASISAAPSVDVSTRDLVDDFGHRFEIGAPPLRIVSLNPATTEILFTIGAGHRLVGRTSWDLYPDSARLVLDLGPGIRPNVEAILATRPDLVILYASRDNRPAADRLRQAGIPTLSLAFDRIEHFRRGTMLLGDAVGESARAATVVDSVQSTLEQVRAATRDLERPRAFWYIWDSPPITIGSGSYMHELIDIAGGANVYGDVAASSPQVSVEDVARRDPDVILAGPGGRRTLTNSTVWRTVPAVAEGRIVIVDTLLVARPSVRLGEAAVSLARQLHPELRW